ncbi:MAG: CRISPR-associated endonuclease Cas2 [Nitrospira sp.]|nr:CRISPR-associated endonuclease Cas2 [Nitrospira sp.]
MRRCYLVAYDIADPKRLRRVFKTMKGYGVHLQLSVFQCDLPEIDLVRMKAALTEIIHHKEDQVLIIDLGPTESHPIKRFEALGMALDVEERGPRVI